jgi:hypothetical protein
MTTAPRPQRLRDADVAIGVQVNSRKSKTYRVARRDRLIVLTDERRPSC